MLVILDGDGAVFQDYIYSSGREGGAEAASLLQQAIKQQLKELYPEANLGDYQIVVNIVLNLQGLGKKLQSCNIISGPVELQSFGRAFGLAQPLFNFIDVGDGKERADHKIRETLRLFLPIPQCKHVFFGPCVDNGYLPFLEPFKRDSLIAPRITLVETRPSEPGFIDLGFRRTKFPSIFRDTNLPNRPMAAPVASPAAMPNRTASSVQVTTSNFVPQSIVIAIVQIVTSTGRSGRRSALTLRSGTHTYCYVALSEARGPVSTNRSTPYNQRCNTRAS